jgi:hypothetical protein
MHTRRRIRRKAGRAPDAARWREACVDGVLHVAFAAAERAEAAAERCVPSGWRAHHGRRGRRRRGALRRW